MRLTLLMLGAALSLGCDLPTFTLEEATAATTAGGLEAGAPTDSRSVVVVDSGAPVTVGPDAVTVGPDAGASSDAKTSLEAGASIEAGVDGGFEAQTGPDAGVIQAPNDAAQVQDGPSAIEAGSSRDYVPPAVPWTPPASCTPHRPPSTWTGDCQGTMSEAPMQYLLVLQQPSPPNCPIGQQMSRPTPAACECGNTYTCDCLAASGAACGGTSGQGAVFVKSCYQDPFSAGMWIIECL